LVIGVVGWVGVGDADPDVADEELPLADPDAVIVTVRGAGAVGDFVQAASAAAATTTLTPPTPTRRTNAADLASSIRYLIAAPEVPILVT
jgi:hypothetical protein